MAKIRGTFMLRIFILVLMTASAVVTGAFAQNQEELLSKFRALNWIKAPANAPIAGIAHIKLVKGQMALGESDVGKFRALIGDEPEDFQFLLAASNSNWYALFNFSPIGYVKDDEQIDPDTLLDALKTRNSEINQDRKRRGFVPLLLDGWYVLPHYDVQTKRLEWGSKLRDPEGNITINYNISMLGRSGVLNALLISDPMTFDQDLKDFHAALTNLTVDPGQQYSEYRSDDKVAEYGLGALVIGGVAASGVKFLPKIIAVAILACIAAFGSFVKRLFSKGKKTA